LSGLRRADFFVITRANQVPRTTLEEISAVLRRWGGHQPIACTAVQMGRLCDEHGAELAPGTIAGRRVLTLAGLGNPQSFERLVSDSGVTIAQSIRVRDHHRYTPADVARVTAAARAAGADFIVTTRKDWVKLHAMWPAGEPPLVRVDLRLDWQTGADLVMEWLRRALETCP
jgi:tetraacyldisaccharide 4'-kinase